MTDRYLLPMIQRLRTEEEVVVYGRTLLVADADARATAHFLESEYQREALDYPHQPPPFDAPAALWAARTVYVAAQLLLHRENKNADLPALLPDFPLSPTASSILSADLCLRFVPALLTQLRLVDDQDALIPTLEARLHQWHYAGVGYPLEVEKLDFGPMAANACLRQLYTDRLVAHQSLPLARHPTCQPWVKASLGTFASQLWPAFAADAQATAPFLP